MPSPYNYTELTEGVNFVEWALIVNNWSSGYLVAGFIVVGFMVTFGVMRAAKVPVTNAMTASGFIWSLISVFFWSIQWNNYTFIPTVVPVLMGVVTGIGLFGIMVNRVFEGS